MKTHLSLNSNYWHKYLEKIDPDTISQVVQEQIIEINGFKVHLDLYEPDPNSLLKGNIIFIHGTSIYSRFYSEFCYEMMQQGFRLIVPDMPGHGLSEGISGHFTMETVTSTLRKLVEYTKERYPGKIAMMGSSLGGISTLYAAAAKVPIDAIICHNAAVFSEDAYKHIITVKGLFKILIPLVPFLAKIFPKMRIGVFKYLQKEKLANNPRGFHLYELFAEDPLLIQKYTLTSLRAQMRDAPINSIEEISTPIMFINGEFDGLFTIEYMQSIFDRLHSKEKEFVIFENQAHLLFQEIPQHVVSKVTPFFEKHLK